MHVASTERTPVSSPESRTESELDPPIDPDIPPPGARRRPEGALLLVIGIAGAVGALARYGLALLITSPPTGFPWSTFAINVSGSLVIGFVLVLLAERFPHAHLARPLVVTGFLGAYTTFSTYAVDTDSLVRHSAIAMAVAYAAASLLVGALATFGGVVLARALLRLEDRLDVR
jgi:CrcB protein